MTKLILTVFTLAVSLSFSVLADEKHPVSATFDEIDIDHDGYITKAEAIQRDDLAKNWKKIDKNDNSKIEVGEFIAYESEGRFAPPEESVTPELGAAPTE
ncbi:MAG: EF-hand domain-containing protein [Gammaproteobacteria bacterium]|nr:EF-hand domain-containing protein [Gammaproteobacteria bacterium]